RMTVADAPPTALAVAPASSGICRLREPKNAAPAEIPIVYTNRASPRDCTICMPLPRCGAAADRARPVNNAPAAPNRTRPKGIAPSTVPEATTRNSVRRGLPSRTSITWSLPGPASAHPDGALGTGTAVWGRRPRSPQPVTARQGVVRGHERSRTAAPPAPPPCSAAGVPGLGSGGSMSGPGRRGDGRGDGLGPGSGLEPVDGGEHARLQHAGAVPQVGAA